MKSSHTIDILIVSFCILLVSIVFMNARSIDQQQPTHTIAANQPK